jgi:hypothetical protein
MSGESYSIEIKGNSNDSNLVLGSTSGVITENGVANLAPLEGRTTTLEGRTTTLEKLTTDLENDSFSDIIGMHLLRIKTDISNNDPVTPIGMDDLANNKVPTNQINLQCRYISVNKRLYYKDGTDAVDGYYYIGKKGDYLWFYEADAPWQQTYNEGINAITGEVGSYYITGHVSYVNLKTRVHQWYFMTEHFTDVTLDKLPLDPKNLYAPNRAAGETDGTLLHYSTGAGDPGIILGGSTYFIERWWTASDMDKMSVSYPPIKIAPDHVGKVTKPTGPLEVEMLQMRTIINDDNTVHTGAGSQFRQLVKNHSLQFDGTLGEWYTYGSSNPGHYGYLTTKGDYMWFFEFFGFTYSLKEHMEEKHHLQIQLLMHQDTFLILILKIILTDFIIGLVMQRHPLMHYHQMMKN